jgi:hypothetical protein
MPEPRPLRTTVDAYVKRPEPLELLAEDILTAHRLATDHGRQALRFALECGELLLEAKAQVPTGSWEDWLRSHLGSELSMTSARIYMRIHHHRSLLDPKTTSVRQAMQAIAGASHQSKLSERKQLVRDMKAKNPELSLRQLAEISGASPSSVENWVNPEAPRNNAARYIAKRVRKTISCPHCGGLLHIDGSKP